MTSGARASRHAVIAGEVDAIWQSIRALSKLWRRGPSAILMTLTLCPRLAKPMAHRQAARSVPPRPNPFRKTQIFMVPGQLLRSQNPPLHEVCGPQYSNCDGALLKGRSQWNLKLQQALLLFVRATTSNLGVLQGESHLRRRCRK